MKIIYMRKDGSALEIEHATAGDAVWLQMSHRTLTDEAVTARFPDAVVTERCLNGRTIKWIVLDDAPTIQDLIDDGHIPRKR